MAAIVGVSHSEANHQHTGLSNSVTMSSLLRLYAQRSLCWSIVIVRVNFVTKCRERSVAQSLVSHSETWAMLMLQPIGRHLGTTRRTFPTSGEEKVRSVQP